MGCRKVRTGRDLPETECQQPEWVAIVSVVGTVCGRTIRGSCCRGSVLPDRAPPIQRGWSQLLQHHEMPSTVFNYSTFS